MPSVFSAGKAVRALLPILAFLPLILTGCDGSSGPALSADRSGPYLRGTINIEAGTRIDQDTALDIEFLKQDRVANPQQPELPADVILGGYVSSRSGDYSPGFAFPVDEKDGYTANLVQGQRVSITFFPGKEGVLETEFRLMDDEDNPVASDNSTDLTKTLVAPHAGEYRIDIVALGGPPTRYVLTSAPLGEGRALEWQSTDFVPGEAIVTLAQPAGELRSAAVALPSVADQRALGQGAYRVRMPRGRGMQSQSAMPRSQRDETLDWIRELREEPGVISVSPNYRIRVAGEPMVQNFYPQQSWHYELINLPDVWANREKVTDVRVAVLDTGVLSPKDDGTEWHPDLQRRIGNNCLDSDQCFNATNPGQPPTDLDGFSFHGTHVAGTIASEVLDRDEIAGVANKVTLLPVKVLGANGGTVADLTAGINWVTNNGNPRAQIINLSLGGSAEAPSLEQALERAEKAGIVSVAAAGNFATSRRFYPAAYESTLSVASVDCKGDRSGFSNFGVWIDLAAPGGGGGNNGCDSSSRLVFSASGIRENDFSGVGESPPPSFEPVPGASMNASLTPGYVGLQGTSMAAPHVAGVVALLLEQTTAIPNDAPALVRGLIREQRLLSDKGGAFSDDGGWGLIDASKLADIGDLAMLTLLEPDRRRVEFGPFQEQESLAFRVVGNRTANVTDLIVTPKPTQNWLTVSDSPGEFNFELNLDRSDLEDDRRYRTDIDVAYQVDGVERSFSIPVTVSPPAEGSLRNAGVHFVQLISLEMDGEVHEVQVAAVQGRYEFSFDPKDITPGEYLLLAGSDIDNDGFLCGPGEACAEFPVTGAPRPITISEDMRKDVRMTTGFTRPVDSQTLGRPGFEGYPRVR